MNRIHHNALRIIEEVKRAAIAVGRMPEEVAILAATKYTDRQGVEQLAQAGIRLMGENRVQDAALKLGELPEANQKDIREEYPGLKVHMIGHLQTNKVNHALKVFDLIETVDRMSIADALEKRLQAIGRTLPVLVEVKLTGEETKTGCSPEDVEALLEHLWSSCPHLEVTGLMGMGPWDPDAETARPYYRKLKTLFDKCRTTAPDQYTFASVSMGMSADFKVAIEEGSTIVRIGRAFFE